MAFELGPALLDTENGKGRIAMFNPRPGLLVTRAEGFMTFDLWEVQIPVYEKAFLQGHVHIYRDAENVRAFDAKYREASQAYLKEHQAQVSSVVFLARSAVLRLAVNAVQLLTRANMTAVDRAAFDARLAQMLKQAA